jgi:hypothetical protein
MGFPIFKSFGSKHTGKYTRMENPSYLLICVHNKQKSLSPL